MTVKNSRNEIGYTQEQMARWLEISLRTYQNIEKRNDCTVKIAKEISKILKKPIEEIFKNDIR